MPYLFLFIPLFTYLILFILFLSRGIDNTILTNQYQLIIFNYLFLHSIK